MKNEKPVIAWFSAGITSTVACKIALEEYKNVRIFYFETGQVHPDNKRYIRECEEWFGQKIERRRSEKYENPIDVAKKTGYVNGPSGARCTLELKKEVRFKIQNEIEYSAQVFGFEFSKKEINRAIRFKQQYPEAKPVFPLIDRKLTKPNCMAIIEKAGIRRPAMYELGYKNNNCVGCFKGGMGYWNKIREDFPDIFEKTAEMEREVGYSCIKGVFLDDLEPGRGYAPKEVMPDCGAFCSIEFGDLEDENLDSIFRGEKTMADIGVEKEDISDILQKKKEEKEKMETHPDKRPLDYLKWYSASAINLYKDCPRKYYRRYVLGQKQPAHPAAKIGKKAAAALEKAIKDGANIDNQLALRALQELGYLSRSFPAPYREPHIHVEDYAAEDEDDWPDRDQPEKWHKRPLRLVDSEVLITLPAQTPILGRADIIDLQGEWPKVRDLKTRGSIKYAPTPPQLTFDNQLLIYAKWLHDVTGSPFIDVGHVNVIREGSYQDTRATIVGADWINEWFEQTQEIVKDIHELWKLPTWQAVPPVDGAPYGEACLDYGGCPYASECQRAGGVSPYAGLDKLEQAASTYTLSLENQTMWNTQQTPEANEHKERACKAFVACPPHIQAQALQGPNGDLALADMHELVDYAESNGMLDQLTQFLESQAVHEVPQPENKSPLAPPAVNPPDATENKLIEKPTEADQPVAKVKRVGTTMSDAIAEALGMPGEMPTRGDVARAIQENPAMRAVLLNINRLTEKRLNKILLTDAGQSVLATVKPSEETPAAPQPAAQPKQTPAPAQNQGQTQIVASGPVEKEVSELVTALAMEQEQYEGWLIAMLEAGCSIEQCRDTIGYLHTARYPDLQDSLSELVGDILETVE